MTEQLKRKMANLCVTCMEAGKAREQDAVSFTCMEAGKVREQDAVSLAKIRNSLTITCVLRFDLSHFSSRSISPMLIQRFL